MMTWQVKMTVLGRTAPEVVFVKAHDVVQAARQAAHEAGVDLSLVFEVVAA